MSTIKFTVEDSEVSEVLKALLNSGVVVRDVEITNTKPNDETCVVPHRYVLTDPYTVPQPYVCDTWRDSTTWSV